MTFEKFSQLIHAKFNELSAHQLYTTTTNPDELFAKYLSSFPEGTNPLYIERTEHDRCSLCGQMLMRYCHAVRCL